MENLSSVIWQLRIRGMAHRRTDFEAWEIKNIPLPLHALEHFAEFVEVRLFADDIKSDVYFLV